MTPQEPLVIGLDCSTHGTKAVAWTLSGEPLAQTRAPVELLCPQPGHYEQQASQWFSSTLQALTELTSQLDGPVLALGITHQRETFVGLDACGAPVRSAIVWMDERAHDQVQALRQTIGEEQFHQRTGKPLSMTPSITKLLWLREHEPRRFEKAATWVDVQGFLVRNLTGEQVTSVGSAEPMGLVDLQSETWDDLLVGQLGLTATQMPRLLPSGSVAGPLLDTIAEQTGLPQGLPVVVTAGDGQVAALGAQILGLDRAYLNLGTAIVSGTISQKFRIDRAFRTMSGALPGTFLFESDLKGGTFTIDWLREKLLGNSLSVEQLEAQASLLAPGAEGLVLVPYWATVMNPYWDDNASGVLLGLRGHHGPGHIFRAILEGIALEQRLHLREIERVSGTEIEEVRVLGGGALSPLWCQILADVLERPVRRAHSQEATSLGAAMLAASATGHFSNAQQACIAMGAPGELFVPGPQAPTYRALFESVYQGLYPALQKAMTQLALLSRPKGPEKRA